MTTSGWCRRGECDWSRLVQRVRQFLIFRGLETRRAKKVNGKDGNLCTWERYKLLFGLGVFKLDIMNDGFTRLTNKNNFVMRIFTRGFFF